MVFDGFCQSGTEAWFQGAWDWLEKAGVRHHFYDGMLGCLAARARVQPGMLIPVACHHAGGQTAVGSEQYQAWAKQQHPEGDQGFWLEAHQIGYAAFRDVLPMHVGNFR